jgi:hypothetical protein
MNSAPRTYLNRCKVLTQIISDCLIHSTDVLISADKLLMTTFAERGSGIQNREAK